MKINVIELVIGAMLGAFASLILNPLAEDKIQKFLVGIFGESQRKSQNLAGKWSQRWWVESVRYSAINEDAEAVIKQLGKRITAKTTIGDRSGTIRKYILIGRVENNYITGTWHDQERGAAYFGAFQLRINANATTLEGVWIGFSDKSSEIKSGKWEWKRPDISKYPSES